MKPRITAKNFIGTFAGQSDAVCPGNLFAKVQHRGFYIGHTWEIAGVDSFEQIVCLRFIVAFEQGVMRSQMFGSKFRKWLVLAGLK